MPPRAAKRRKTTGESATPIVIDDSTPEAITNNASLSTLPDELLIDILSYVSTKDALSLLQTAKCFERPCKIRLYRTIVLVARAHPTTGSLLPPIQGQTAISGWANIFKFFRMVYLRSRVNPNDKSLSCVEHVISFGNLDDIADHPEELYKLAGMEGMDDSEIVAEFRQLFVKFIEVCQNLKSLVLPLISLKRLLYVDQRRMDSIYNVALKLSGSDSSTGNSLDYIPSLKHAERLTINIEGYTVFPSSALSKVVERAPVLSELELCGDFGAYDDEISLQLKKNHPERVLSPLKLLNRNQKSYRPYTSPSNAEIMAAYMDFCDFIPISMPLLADEAVRPISGVALSKLTLTGWSFPEKETFNSQARGRGGERCVRDWMSEMLKKSIESNSLTELNIIGCAAPMINVASGRTPVIQGLSMLLRSTDFQKYEHLKVLTIGQNEYCLNNRQFKGKKQNQVLEGLSQFSLKTKSKLTHIHIYSYGQWDLKTQVLPILTRMSDSLLHFSFLDDLAINDVMRRVISIKALAKVLYSGDLSSLDEQISREEEKMKEFVYSTHTINNYGHRNRFNEYHLPRSLSTSEKNSSIFTRSKWLKCSENCQT